MPLTQHNNQQLQFLQDKIHQIGSAIFHNQSDAVLKLPTSVVSTFKADDNGYVWFFIKKPHQDIRQFESDFPTRLDFFKKGVDFFLQVSGKGWIITDPEEICSFMEMNPEVDPAVFSGYVLVKVKMLKAEYYETQPRTKSTWLSHAFSTITTWFRSTNNVGHNTFFPAS